MEYRNLGRTGLKVSPLCMGTMQFGWTADEETSFAVLSESYEAGINFIDTANVYSRWVEGNPGGVSEEIIGRWIKASAVPRDQLIIATKVRGRMGDGPNDEGLSRVHILHQVEESLRRLETDYIDLYQTHSYDDNTPIDETLSALDDLVRTGKVRYIGCSNYPAWRLMESLWVADSLNLSRYDCIQPHYNLAHRREFEAELQKVCEKFGIGVIPYSPLAGGFLTGKYRRGGDTPDSDRQVMVRRRYFNERGWKTLDALIEVADELEGASPSQVAIAWLLSNPVVTSPIVGPRNLEQLQDNLDSLQISLSQDQVRRLESASAA
ncbi:MAG: aldo/keto reductase [Anaerolineales bacterium]|nr:aldo/keto reductase [Anaerolineales bacterium]